VEIREFPFKPDAAILLCSDGLSDALSSAQINGIIEQYDGDPERTAQELVAAANDASGVDNITAIFVAGADFLGTSSEVMAEARERHSVTRERVPEPARLRSIFAGRMAFLIYGLILGWILSLAVLGGLRFR
jgi:hypothetical protein